MLNALSTPEPKPPRCQECAKTRSEPRETEDAVERLRRSEVPYGYEANRAKLSKGCFNKFHTSGDWRPRAILGGELVRT